MKAKKAPRSTDHYLAALPEDHRKELERFDTSKGTIRFQPDAPLPAKLVRKLVKARIAEIAAE